MSDPGSTYRTRDEISNMRQLRDPVEHVRKLLLEKAGADPAELKKIEKVCLLGPQVLSPAVCQEPYIRDLLVLCPGDTRVFYPGDAATDCASNDACLRCEFAVGTETTHGLAV